MLIKVNGADKIHLYRALQKRQRKFKNRLLLKAKRSGEYGYIEMVTPYLNVRTPIKLKCLKCGIVFKRNPVSIFKNKSGICPNHIKKVLMKINGCKRRKQYHRELIIKEKQTGEYGKIKQLTPYKNWTSEIVFKCLDCGLIFKRKPSGIYGCNYICSHKAYINKRNKLHKSQAFSMRRVQALINKRIDSSYIVLSKCYINSQTKLLFEHHSRKCIYYRRYHKYYRFKMALSSFFAGHYCPKDGRARAHLKFKMTPIEFKRKILGQYHRKYLVKSRYIDNRHKVLIEHHSKQCLYYRRCHKYYCWWTFPRSVLRFHSMCPKERYAKIADSHRKSLLDIKHKVTDLVGDEFRVLSKWHVDGHVQLSMIHKSKQCSYYQKYHCYYKFNTKADNFYSSLKCPYDNISCGEKAIMLWLNKQGLKQYQDYYYAYILKHHIYTRGRQHLDFYLPNIKYNKYYINGIGIEFDGIQHFNMVDFGYIYDNNSNILKSCNNLIDNMLRDRIKNRYCYKHRIKLIRIENKYDYVGKRLRELVKITLNQRLLPILRHAINE